MRLSSEGLAEAAGDRRAAVRRARRARLGRATRRSIREVHLDIRFVGQEHTLTVPVPAPGRAVVADDPEPVAERFLDEYERTFGSILDEEVEIVCVRAIATTPLDRDGRDAVSTQRRAPARRRARTGPTQAWSFTAGELADFAVVDARPLGREAEVEGPAIVREQTTTTYVDRGYRATVTQIGALMIAREVTRERSDASSRGPAPAAPAAPPTPTRSPPRSSATA